MLTVTHIHWQVPVSCKIRARWKLNQRAIGRRGQRMCGCQDGSCGAGCWGSSGVCHDGGSVHWGSQCLVWLEHFL